MWNKVLFTGSLYTGTNYVLELQLCDDKPICSSRERPKSNLKKFENSSIDLFYYSSKLQTPISKGQLRWNCSSWSFQNSQVRRAILDLLEISNLSGIISIKAIQSMKFPINYFSGVTCKLPMQTLVISEKSNQLYLILSPDLF